LAVAPAIFIKIPHFSISEDIIFLNSSEELPTGIEPCSISLFLKEGSCNTVLRAVLSLFTISVGVAAGAKMPFHN